MKKWLFSVFGILGLGIAVYAYAQNNGADPVYAGRNVVPLSAGKPVLVERMLPNKIRKSLGLKPDDFVMAMTPTKTIIFNSEDFKGRTGEGESAFGRTLIKNVQITQSRNSPDCFSYRDGEGNQKWWPKDCPK